MSGLPWIKVWTAVGQHPKLRRLEKELGVEDALGIVLRLWCWTAEYHPGGEIPGVDADSMAQAAMGGIDRYVQNRNVSDKDVTLACVTAGFLDVTGDGFTVHDWRDLQVTHAEAEERRRAQNRERQARFRALHNKKSRNAVTRDTVTEKEKEKEISTEAKASVPAAPNGAGAKTRNTRPADPALDALRLELMAAYRATRGEELDWPRSAWGDLQAIRKALADDAEVKRRWGLFLETKFWPIKSVHKFRDAFPHAKFQASPSPALPDLPSIPVFR